MDLGIAGRNALVCASSKGLGFACAEALVAEGVNVVINGRDRARLDEAVAQLQTHRNGEVDSVVGDITTAEGRSALLRACTNPDILINNNAGPEPKEFLFLEESDWLEAVKANMVAPLLLIRAVLPGMRARKFGRIINITSAMVTAPRPHMALSAGARGGLTVAAKGQSIAFARDNITINNLLPERIDTGRQQYMAQVVMQREGISYEEARRRQVDSIAAKRLGDPKEFGATCAFLCSRWAGYISGQNIHLDGGSYPGVI
jgi:3-oxoacyl-[acyl-carrier protein] reductase